jgi:hypothetical protein
MVTKQLSIAIAIGICIVSGLVWSDLKTFAAAPASEPKIDFDQVVNRAGKSDRLPNFKSALPEPALLPYCEPVASPFVDPILSRIVGRCVAYYSVPAFSRRLLRPVRQGDLATRVDHVSQVRR